MEIYALCKANQEIGIYYILFYDNLKLAKGDCDFCRKYMPEGEEVFICKAEWDNHRLQPYGKAIY